MGSVRTFRDQVDVLKTVGVLNSMLVYPVKSVGAVSRYTLHLADWPEVCLPGSEYSREKLNAALRAAVREHMRAGRLIPLPRSRPRDGIDARLSAAQSMKVLVLNEMVRSGASCHSLAQTLCMPVDFVRAGLDISQPLNIDLLESIVGALGRRWVAYIA